MARPSIKRVPKDTNKDATSPIPFEEALRRMVNAPPQHKTAKLTKKKPGRFLDRASPTR